MSEQTVLNLQKLMITAEIANLTGLSAKYIQQLCREGKIPHIRMGREYRFQRSDVTDWLRSITQGGG